MKFTYTKKQLDEIFSSLNQISVSGQTSVLSLAFVMQILSQGEELVDTSEEE